MSFFSAKLGKNFENEVFRNYSIKISFSKSKESQNLNSFSKIETFFVVSQIIDHIIYKGPPPVSSLRISFLFCFYGGKRLFGAFKPQEFHRCHTKGENVKITFHSSSPSHCSHEQKERKKERKKLLLSIELFDSQNVS